MHACLALRIDGSTSTCVSDCNQTKDFLAQRACDDRDMCLQVVAFCDQLVPFPLRKDEPLHKVIKRTSELLMGGTDCSLPITHALENKLDVDVFVVLTDSETCES